MTYCLMTELFTGYPKFCLCHSKLSKYSHPGFKLGYSQVMLNSVVTWEAQYRNFSNHVQYIVYTFTVSGKVK